MSFKKSILCLALVALLGAAPAYAAGDDLAIIRDEEIEQSLKTMCTPIFKQAGLSPQTVKFVLVDSPEMNAFVAGGQNIFLFTDLMLKTDNPEELLGVIAHETGHIADGHLFRGRAEASNLSAQAILTQLLGVAVAIGARAPDAGIAISSASNSLLTRTFLRHTRTQEGAADRAGVRFLEGAGIPVTGFLSFMKKLGAQELIPESEQSEYVQTHPLAQDRIESLQHAVDEHPGGTVPPDWVEMHRRMKAKLLGYLFPDRMLVQKDASVATQYGRAIAWFRKHQLDKATETLAPLLKAEPNNAYFHELEGQMMFENGRIEDAIAAYGTAARLLPSSGLIRIAYAHSLLEARDRQEERTNEAVRQLIAALEIENQVAEPHHLLAIAYGKQGQVGLSRLHLAEENVLRGKPEIAKREALLAKTNLKKGTPAYQRALDILQVVDKEKDGDKGAKDRE